MPSFFGFPRRGKPDIRVDYPPPSPADVSEWRLIKAQDHILCADQIVRRLLATRLDRATQDGLLEVLVALGTAPAADDEVPVTPGRS